MNWITLVGIILIAVGTGLSIWGQNFKSDYQIKELIEGKNTLILQNNKLSNKIGIYQEELELKQQQIDQLNRKVEPKLLNTQKLEWVQLDTGYQAKAIFRSEVPTSEVSNVKVEIEFDDPYNSATYQVVLDNPQSAMMLQELYCAVGSNNSRIYKIGFYKLPANSTLVITFNSEKPVKLKRILL